MRQSLPLMLPPTAAGPTALRGATRCSTCKAGIRRAAPAAANIITYKAAIITQYDTARLAVSGSDQTQLHRFRVILDNHCCPLSINCRSCRRLQLPHGTRRTTLQCWPSLSNSCGLIERLLLCTPACCMFATIPAPTCTCACASLTPSPPGGS
jgi:hypothetical protein